MGYRLDDRQTVSGLTLPAGKTDFTFWDETLKGFGLRLRIGCDGKPFRRFLVIYRVAGRQRMQIIKDPPGKALTEKAAREIAITMLGKVHEGVDPAVKKDAAREASSGTFKSAVDQYIKAEQHTWSASSLAQKELYLQRGDYFKALRTMPISSITRKDIAPLIRDIRTNHSDNTAKQARTQLSSLFSWALGEGLADQDANPVIDTNEPEGNGPRERTLMPHELKAIWNACENAGDYGKIVRLLMLSGCRREEIGELRWSWFALDMTSFKIPDTKNGRAHTVPVTGMMRAILDSVPRMVDRDCLFGVYREGFTQWGDKAKLGDGCEPWQLRDIRRTFRSGLGKLKVPPHVAELAVNHKKQGLIATYDTHTYEDEIAEAFTKWSNHVATILSDGKVVAFPQSA